MWEPTSCGYETLPDSVQGPRPASGNKFFVFLAGNTNRAHWDLVQRLEHLGQTEATSAQQCNYILAFCPVASRVGTDVQNALSKAPALKPLVLVVMHHTFDPDHVVADSRRQVTDPRVQLTVDCLFYENHFLDCQRNDDAWCQISNHIRRMSCAPGRKGRGVSLPTRPSIPDCSSSRMWIVCGVLVFVLVITIILLVKFCKGCI